MKTNKYLSFALVLFMPVLFSCNSGGENATGNMSNAAAPKVKFSDTAITKVSNNQVCMVNNRLMNSVQIAVPLNDKIYYGCCDGCVKMLKEDSASHFAIDPLSGEWVDKAIAFIIGKPGTKEDVLYFKSETNARTYFKNIVSTKKN